MYTLRFILVIKYRSQDTLIQNKKKEIILKVATKMYFKSNLTNSVTVIYGEDKSGFYFLSEQFTPFLPLIRDKKIPHMLRSEKPIKVPK